MISDDEYIHAFRSAPFCLIGADWDRYQLTKTIEASKCEIGGEKCQAMNHGLVVWDTDENPLFVRCKDDFDYEEFEKGLTQCQTEQQRNE